MAPGTALCPSNAAEGCAPIGTVQSSDVSRGVRLSQVNEPARTLTGRTLFDAQGQAVGQIAEVRLQKGRPSSVIVVLNNGERVSVRASRLFYLSDNNALITRMSRDAVEKMKRLK